MAQPMRTPNERAKPLPTDRSAIVVQGLTKRFKQVRVLEGIDLVAEPGTMVALLGPNGAGKTTIVRILSTLLEPDGGSARVGGYDVVADARKVRTIIGLTGQYAAVDELLSGRRNLEMMGRLYHLSRNVSKRRAEELLAHFDLTDAAERSVKTYSGGMRRRLDLAASLVAVPPIVFLDEPTTGLDPRSRLAMWAVIESLKSQGVTILLTTQYLEEADKLADRIAVLDRGRIIAEGTGDELKAQVGSERVEMVIAGESDYELALAVVRETGNLVQSSPEARGLSVSTDGSVRAVKHVLDALYAAGIELDRMSVEKPTLDDVFLELTGHGTSDGHGASDGSRTGEGQGAGDGHGSSDGHGASDGSGTGEGHGADDGHGAGDGHWSNDGHQAKEPNDVASQP